jgi:hypothetical protein
VIRAGQPAHDLSFPTIPAHLAVVAKRDGLTPLRAGSWDFLVRPVRGVVLVYVAPAVRHG